ncbi:hypothetical protein O0L34_g8230 [Tuta absoluta]|nr:hypothetical protein O0L34_g8230 [Tuta absoluta]
MDEGPPGAEGYEDDSVTVKPNKKPVEDSCTKAEQEFVEHLNSLKIKLEDGEARPMVERRGRDVSGKWIYLCFPCGAMCSGESVLQTHISGKKHKTKLALRSVWPNSIYDDHPYNQQGKEAKSGTASEKVLQKMAEEVDLHNKPPSALEVKYNKYRDQRCHIQDTVDQVKTPLLGLEYLIEHPPEQAHYEPSYICVLCSKQGHPRTIMNHMTCFWHRCNYLARHFPKASGLLAPYRSQNKYREGVYVIMNRLSQRIEGKYGRMRPVNIDKDEYDKHKELIHQWIFKSHHYSEQPGCTFEEVVDADLITSLHESNDKGRTEAAEKDKDPSPPTVAAPTKPNYRRRDRRNSDELSDISDDDNARRALHERDHRRDRHEPRRDTRFRPYDNRRRPEDDTAFRSRFALRNPPDAKEKPNQYEKRPPNYEHKTKMALSLKETAEKSAVKTLAYHEKNPEKHPLYPEEWKKFWNRRYKEIQAEGKDPSKHDFKPEWIVFWTTRMKELHEEELRANVQEIYRKLCLTPPPTTTRRASPERAKPPEARPRSRPRGYSRERRRSPEPRRRSPEPRRRSPEHRRRSPPDMRREMRRSPEYRRHSPLRHLRTRSRSPIPRARSPPRMHINLDSLRRSRSPLSRRDEASRNRSPAPQHHHGPSSQTVMISDDELKPDDNLSPWNSDNDIDSLGSLPDARSPMPPRSHTGSVQSSRASRSRQFPSYQGGGRGADPKDLGPAENVVATLRLLVALEDYLGSLGPKIVDLMTEALKMEKDSPNSSEELLERESAVVLIETAKEKLKGAMQAGLVPPQAQAALRNAVVRAASTLHEADNRAKKKQQQQASSKPASGPAVSVAGVGAVDRAQIAQQMAAALIAQGKTDVSSEELQQLVDAVVGMAEAKKREAEVKAKQEARAVADMTSRPPAPAPAPSPAIKQASASASALQMLQSAYDENDKRSEKEDVPDAMDGLSDSDLETLLKNFNELSAEEQHSLIAYLKKLEAREPQRVERLRQYVSAAATSTPAVQEAPPPPKKEEPKLVTIESDDDDYTVEDVFKSVTQKVKEDQIRQEMEIVKKSLEETAAEPEPVHLKPVVDLTDTSSAAGLFALVQASIASSSAQTPQDAVASVSANMPRSFGDAPEPIAGNNQAPQGSFNNQGPQGSFNNQGPQGSFNNQGPQGSFNNQGPQGSFNNQGSFGEQDSFGNQGPPGTFGNQGQRFPNQNNFAGPNQGNFGGPNQGNFGAPTQNNFGPNQGNFGGPNQGNFGGPNQSNFSGPPRNFGGPNQGNFGGNIEGSNQSNFGGPKQGNIGGNRNFSPWEKDNINAGLGSFTPPGQDFNQGPRGANINGRMPNNFGNQGNFQGNNFQGNNNFRGRGGGGGRGNFRGRGRGYF